MTPAERAALNTRWNAAKPLINKLDTLKRWMDSDLWKQGAFNFPPNDVAVWLDELKDFNLVIQTLPSWERAAKDYSAKIEGWELAAAEAAVVWDHPFSIAFREWAATGAYPGSRPAYSSYA